MPHHICILRCANGAFYVGHTHDLAARVAAHNAGRGSSYTRRNGPVVVVYSEPSDTEAEAVSRERQINGWSRAKKRALIEGNLKSLRALARQHAVR